ncbi:hypothetical protein KY092_16280 [Natronomonas gomsonensis]|uniref:hypothetical protein n=1 Tax=Natronomonas gomsonensis TaxID=1046043 RepID=UPI00227D1FDA|nr:hypothetical protein [Natronomonas gomsonensis]MCY4732120.1 hypothetical protein [Natronomonas gomsonensis]
MSVGAGENSDIGVAEVAIMLEAGQQCGGLNRQDSKPVGIDAALDATGVRISLLETSFDDLKGYAGERPLALGVCPAVKVECSPAADCTGPDPVGVSQHVGRNLCIARL